jgi:hypothetical protein
MKTQTVAHEVHKKALPQEYSQIWNKGPEDSARGIGN